MQFAISPIAALAREHLGRGTLPRPSSPPFPKLPRKSTKKSGRVQNLETGGGSRGRDPAPEETGEQGGDGARGGIALPVRV